MVNSSESTFETWRQADQRWLDVNGMPTSSSARVLIETIPRTQA